MTGWPIQAAAAALIAVVAAAAGYLAGRRTPAPSGPGAVVDGVITAYDLARGADAVRAQLERVLHAAGVDRIGVAGGAAFDPAVHHAVGTEQAAGPAAESAVESGAESAAGPAPDRSVAREVRPGWRQGDRVVRPAEVIVWTR